MTDNTPAHTNRSTFATADLRAMLRKQHEEVHGCQPFRIHNDDPETASDRVHPIPLDPSRYWNWVEIGGGGTGYRRSPNKMTSWADRPNVWRENKCNNVIVTRAHGENDGGGYHQDEFMRAMLDPDARYLVDGFVDAVGDWTSENPERRFVYYTGGQTDLEIWKLLCTWLGGIEGIEIALDIGVKIDPVRLSTMTLMAQERGVERLWLEPVPQDHHAQYRQGRPRCICLDRMARLYHEKRWQGFQPFQEIEELVIVATGHDRANTLEDDMEFCQRYAWVGTSIAVQDWQADEWIGRAFEIQEIRHAD